MSSENVNVFSKENVDTLQDDQLKFYLSTMERIYTSIFEEMYEENKDAIGDDQYTVATSVEEMLYITRYLYLLDKLNVDGDVLECGCFKGFSSSCLSWATSYIGKTFIVADSFQGLPDVGHEIYKPHEYRGDFDLVTGNIRDYGVIRNVDFIRGWYRDSLKGFDRDLSMIWMDVDLYESVISVLNNTYDKLSKDGVILSHEFRDDITTSEVFVAIQNFFQAKEIEIKIERLVGNLGVVYRV